MFSAGFIWYKQLSEMYSNLVRKTSMAPCIRALYDRCRAWNNPKGSFCLLAGYWGQLSALRIPDHIGITSSSVIVILIAKTLSCIACAIGDDVIADTTGIVGEAGTIGSCGACVAA